MSQANATINHDEIRKWVEERGGRPARVKRTAEKGDEGGILRIDFGEPEKSLEEISWDDFFEVFDDRKLAFLHQDQKSGSEQSYFFKFVHRDTVKV
jgi:hypothetical protein